MKEIRESHTLRFSAQGWKLMTERAKAIFGSEKSRARFLEELVKKEHEISKEL